VRGAFRVGASADGTCSNFPLILNERGAFLKLEYYMFDYLLFTSVSVVGWKYFLQRYAEGFVCFSAIDEFVHFISGCDR
jgi:hypothetical protein